MPLFKPKREESQTFVTMKPVNERARTRRQMAQQAATITDKRVATRSTTKNTTTFSGTINKDRESNPNEKDYVAQLPKRKLKVGAPKNTKKKTSCDKGERRMTKEQN